MSDDVHENVEQVIRDAVALVASVPCFHRDTSEPKCTSCVEAVCRVLADQVVEARRSQLRFEGERLCKACCTHDEWAASAFSGQLGPCVKCGRDTANLLIRAAAPLPTPDGKDAK